MWDIRCWTVGLKVINMKYFVDLDPVPEDDQRNWTQVLLPPPQCVSRSCCDQLRTEVTLHAGSKAIPFRHVRKDFRGLSLERWSHLACILFWVINGPFSWANYIYILMLKSVLDHHPVFQVAPTCCDFLLQVCCSRGRPGNPICFWAAGDLLGGEPRKWRRDQGKLQVFKPAIDSERDSYYIIYIWYICGYINVDVCVCAYNCA